MISIKKKLVKYLRQISYGLFFILYGHIKKYSDYRSFKEIKSSDIKIDDKHYSVFKIEKSRLYTDRIHNTAVIINNILIKGPSFQLINNNNSEIQNNIVLKIGTPRKIKKIKGNVLSLLTGGGGNDNYWHWLFDVLPRIKLSENIINKNDINFLLVPDNTRPFQMETLEKLNFSKNNILSSKEYRHISSDFLIVTDHPFIKKNSHKESQNLPNWILKWLKNEFSEKLINNKDFPKRIFIDRSDSRFNSDPEYRSLSNEDEIKNYLKKRDFVPIRLSEYSFIDQISMFASAQHIIGLHGAGFANIIFCKENTRVSELRTSKTGKIIENLGKKLNLKTNFIEKKPINNQTSVQQGRIEVSVNELDKLLN